MYCTRTNEWQPKRFQELPHSEQCSERSETARIRSTLLRLITRPDLKRIVAVPRLVLWSLLVSSPYPLSSISFQLTTFEVFKKPQLAEWALLVSMACKSPTQKRSSQRWWSVDGSVRINGPGKHRIISDGQAEYGCSRWGKRRMDTTTLPASSLSIIKECASHPTALRTMKFNLCLGKQLSPPNPSPLLSLN
jgi:hypothetical protein